MHVDSAQQGSASPDHDRELRALKLSVILYVVVVVIKLAAWLGTGSMALLAEGLHTLSDIFVSGFLLVAATWSRKKPDEKHQFGYGRAQYVGALVAAVLFVSFTSFELYKESIPRLFAHDAPPVKSVPVVIGVILLSMVIALAPLLALLRQKSRGAAAKAQLLELVNDQLGLIAALIGTIVVALGYPIGDPLSAVVVATIIAVAGVGLFRENLSYLVGRSPGAEYLQNAEKLALNVHGVLGVHALRGQMIGPDSVHLEVHVEVEPELSVFRANVIAHEVVVAIDALTPNDDVISVHVDPHGIHERAREGASEKKATLEA